MVNSLCTDAILQLDLPCGVILPRLTPTKIGRNQHCYLHVTHNYEFLDDNDTEDDEDEVDEDGGLSSSVGNLTST